MSSSKVLLENVTLVSGHFNGLTPDHCLLLHYAHSFGLPVIVGLNGDLRNVIKNGPRAIPAMDRQYLLESVRYVSGTLVFNEPDPRELLMQVRPVNYIKGPDYIGVGLIEQSVCDELGIQVRYRPGDYRYASSRTFSMSLNDAR